MDKLVDLLVIAGVLALVALPVAVLVIGVLVTINRRRSHAVKVWMTRHDDLKRRLADVEALRRREAVAANGPDVTPSMIREHVGDPPYDRQVCDETQGDCS